MPSVSTVVWMVSLVVGFRRRDLSLVAQPVTFTGMVEKGQPMKLVRLSVHFRTLVLSELVMAVRCAAERVAVESQRTQKLRVLGKYQTNSLYI